MKITHYSIYILFLCIMLLVSCAKEDPDMLSDTIYVSHEGADMPAYIHGNASEKVFLLVVHGAGSLGLGFRTGAFTAELEKRYAVVYWDQRGQGMSQGHYSQPDDVIDLMAKDLLALVAVLRHKYGEDIKLFMMGHSWGGALSAAVLVDPVNQPLFKGWIEVDGAHDFQFAGTARRQLLLSIVEEQILLGYEPDTWEEIYKEVSNLDSLSDDDYAPMLDQAQAVVSLLVESGAVEPSGVSSEELYRIVIDNNPINWKVSALFNRPFIYARDIGYSVTQELFNIRIPTLLLWGKYDISVPPVLGYDALRRLGTLDKKLVIFDRSVHHPYDTEPDKFAEEVIQFIDRLK
ncbi:MAG: alpha/beta hydrolase [Bacteroidia bacterium]